MKQQKSLATNKSKKRRILLGTLIPLSCMAITAAIALPILLIKCNKAIKLTVDQATIDNNHRTANFEIENTKSKSEIT
jgi:hypothetical protein